MLPKMGGCAAGTEIEETFYKLLGRIEHILERENANIRKAISAKVCLQVTLCYLANGSSYKILSLAFRLS